MNMDELRRAELPRGRAVNPGFAGAQPSKSAEIIQ